MFTYKCTSIVLQVQNEGLFSLDHPYGFNQTAIIFPFWPKLLKNDPFFESSIEYLEILGGSVKYLEIHAGPELEQLSSLIRAKQGVNFVGSWALVAEWRSVPGLTDKHDLLVVSKKY